MAFPDGWGYSCSITIASGLVSGSTALSNFPVLLSEQNVPGYLFLHAQATGADIRFTTDAAGLSEIACDIVQFDVGSSTASIYVLVPSLSATSDTTIYLWYGNASVDFPAQDSTYGREAVWAGYAGVWAFWGSAPTQDRTGGGVHLPYGAITTTGRSTVEVRDDTGYSAFPSLVSLGGDNLLLTWREADIHLEDVDGFLQVYSSDDAGRSWSSLTTIGSADTTYDYRDPNLLLDSSGDVWITYTKADLSAAVGESREIFYQKSTDSGATWGSAVAVSARNATIRGKPIEVESGDILFPIYEINSSGNTRPVLSVYNGTSFTDYVVEASYSTYNEWSLVEDTSTTPNDLYGFFREQGSDGVRRAVADVSGYGSWTFDGADCLITSADSPPEAQYVSSGDLLLAVSYERWGTAPACYIRRSIDNGATFEAEDLAYLIASDQYISGGSGFYPSFCEVTNGHFVYAMYADSASIGPPSKILTGTFELGSDGKLLGQTEIGTAPDFALDSGGSEFPNSSLYAKRAISATLNYPHQNTTYTIGSVAKLDGYTTDAIQTIASTAAASSVKGFMFHYENRSGIDSGALRHQRLLSGGSLAAFESDDNAIADNNYHLLNCVLDSNSPTFYVDGVSKGGTTTTSATSTTGDAEYPIAVGRYQHTTPGGSWDGKIGTFYCYAGVRSADWLATEYNNLNSPSSFASASCSLQVSFLLPSSWVSSLGIESQEHIAWESSTASLQSIASAWVGSLDIDSQGQVAWESSLSLDCDTPLDWATSQSVSLDCDIPLDWVTSQEVDTESLINWLHYVPGVGQISVDWLSSLQDNTQVPYVTASSIASLQPTAIEWLALGASTPVTSDALVPVEWQAVTSLSSDSEVPFSWSSSLSSATRVYVGWGGTQVFAYSTQGWYRDTSGTEFTITVNGASFYRETNGIVCSLETRGSSFYEDTTGIAFYPEIKTYIFYRD